MSNCCCPSWIYETEVEFNVVDFHTVDYFFKLFYKHLNV